MKRILWQWLEEQTWRSNIKTGVFIASYMSVMCVIGFLMWIPLSVWFPGIDMLICLIGYLVYFAGYVGSILYICRHEFS